MADSRNVTASSRLELSHAPCHDDTGANNAVLPQLANVTDPDFYTGPSRKTNSPHVAPRDLDILAMPNHQNDALNGRHFVTPGTERHEVYDFVGDGMESAELGGHSLAAAHLPGTRTPRGLFDFGTDTNLAFDDVDLAFLNEYNQNLPFHVNTPTTWDFVNEMPATVNTDGSQQTSAGMELPTTHVVEKPSIWRFRPTPTDNNYNNLALPGTKQSGTLLVHRRVSKEPLGAITRDEILWMLMQARPDPRSLLSFPSAGLLDSLLQFCLSSKVGPTAFIHIPTFDPLKKRAELCSMLAATGAMLAPDSTMHKLGLAMQEAVRLGVNDKVSRIAISGDCGS